MNIFLNTFFSGKNLWHLIIIFIYKTMNLTLYYVRWVELFMFFYFVFNTHLLYILYKQTIDY